MDIRDMAMPTVGVSIVTYKRAESLHKTLQCLAEQKHTDFRVVHVAIVNDGSHDAEYEAVIKEPRPFDLDYIARDRDPQDRPRVYSCRNKAVAASRGEVLWLLDDDLRFDDHTLFIVQLYHMLFEGRRVVLIPHYADRDAPHYYQEPFSFNPPWPIGHPDEGRARIMLSFAGSSLRRVDWDKVGGVDEAYDGSMGFADHDLGLRLHQNGCNICQIDGACCFIDDAGESWRSYFLQKLHPDGNHPNGDLFHSRWPDY